MPTLLRPLRRFTWPTAGALLGVTGMAGLYLTIVTVAESWAHALDLFRRDARFVAPILLGFGLQIGLLIWLRRQPPVAGEEHHHPRPSPAPRAAPRLWRWWPAALTT